MMKLVKLIPLALCVLSCGAPSTATLSVDATDPGETLWNPVAHVNTFEFQRVDWEHAHRNPESDVFAFVDYVQLMQCSGGSERRDLFRDPTDRTVLDDYDFTPLVEACRSILSLGAKPMLKLGSVPLKYTSVPVISRGFSTNVCPPDDYKVYYDYIYHLAEALSDAFGLEEIRSWRYGVMTEYQNEDWFTAGSPEETFEAYCKLYDYTAAALADVVGEENLFIGAHSMSQSKGLWDERDFIRHCANGTNWCTGKTGSPLRYLSTSFYDPMPGMSHPFTRDVVESVDYLREEAVADGFTDLVYGIDEGRLLLGKHSGAHSRELGSRSCGYTYQAGYDAHLYHRMFDNHIDYFSSWSYLSDGLFDGNPSVAFHVADGVSKFTGMKRVPALRTSGNKRIGTVAASSDSLVRVMVYNYKNSLNYKDSVRVSMQVALPWEDGTSVNVTCWQIDDDSNYFDEWLTDRAAHGIGNKQFGWSPDDYVIEGTLLREDDRAWYRENLAEKYRECSRLVPVSAANMVSGNKIELSGTISPNGVCFYEITR